MPATGFDYWIDQANKQGQTDYERQMLRNQVRARYGLGPEKKKSWWDKAKNWIIPVASAVVGLLTAGTGSAPVYAALTGAAARGIDEGSIKGALRGAGEGFLAGAGGAAIGGAVAGGAAGTGVAGTLAGAGRGAASGVGKYLGRGAATGAVSSGDAATVATREIGQVHRVLDPSRGGYVNVGAVSPPVQGGSKLSGLLGGAGKVGTAVQSTLSGMKPETMQGILQGGGMALGGYLNRETEQERIRFEREQQAREQERANRLAELLAPMAVSQGQLIGSQYGAYGQMR